MTKHITNLGNIEITERQLTSALRRAALETRTVVRTDSEGEPIYPGDMIDRYRQRWDALAAAELGRQGVRLDALTPGAPGDPRDFDLLHREILEEARPQLNSGMMFPADSTTVPLGFPTHTARRAIVTGKAKWHNRGEGFPVVKAGYLTEQFRTGNVVCAVEASFFEGLALGAAGLPTYRLEAEGALRAIEEFLNNVALYGDVAKLIYGAFTYPHLAKMVLCTTAGVATPLTSASTGRDILNALNNVVNYAMIRSGGTYRPNRMFTSEAVRAYLATTPLDTSGGATMILKAFLEGQSQTTGIRDIEVAHELSAAEMTAAGAGNPSGHHGIFCFNDAPRSVKHIMPRPPTFLPIWNSSPIDTLHVAYANTGGIVMHDVGNNLLAYCTLN